ncbi:MAG: DUF445 family protein [Parasporobacterium sp.]|nr:DUF445 family protein [Parasporobacterium sp.]
MFLDILHYISGPVIGAVIGALTNYLAIKMLFRPLKPVRIGRFTLPFTPGIIPRHQEKLADSLSDTVYKNFFTNSDIEGIFMSEEMAERFSEGLYRRLSQLEVSSLQGITDEETIKNLKKQIYLKIHMKVLTTDITGLFEEEVRNILKSGVSRELFASILPTDDLAVKIAGYAGEKLTDYLMNHDLELIWPILNELEKELKELDAAEAADLIGFDQDMIKGLIKAGYFKFMGNAKSAIAEGFHMKQFIYNKIMELDPGEIEKHVNNSIKREMNYLVYLGGFLGLLIGVVNIFI